MGWESRFTPYDDHPGYYFDGEFMDSKDGWTPSTNISYAWLVVERMRERDEETQERFASILNDILHQKHGIDFSKYGSLAILYVTGEDICLAALKVNDH